MEGEEKIDLEAEVEWDQGEECWLWVGSRSKGIDAQITLSEISIDVLYHEEAVTRRVDYFPSYELINSPAAKGMFFEKNEREINKVGVDFVMGQFFSSYGVTKSAGVVAAPEEQMTFEDVICDEILYDKR